MFLEIASLGSEASLPFRRHFWDVAIPLRKPSSSNPEQSFSEIRRFQYHLLSDSGHCRRQSLSRLYGLRGPINIPVPNFELFVFISDLNVKILVSLFKIKIPVEVTRYKIKIISSHKVEVIGESSAGESKPEHGSQAELLNGDHFK
ncbi:unnamed protein product [Clonostachys chloroleuca]|uniref:Uncharacterized protein n=1 Tax=Clonostachys chloroleuca TaxID=1926264 RepID=A0AA35Q102_9HYPO|nr:unnamed protein product [Clonostachys chloroleuca]